MTAGPLIRWWRRLSTAPAVLPATRARIYAQWVFTGRPIPPPPIVKQLIVRRYQRRFGLRVFIETGTFAGEMIQAVLDRFERIVSIELDPGLAARARARFLGHDHVIVLEGDSAARLAEILGTLDRPALFWLDAHYAGPSTARSDQDSPVIAEVQALLRSAIPGHVVLIDDARLFDGTQGYPTIDGLRRMLSDADPAAECLVYDDIIRWHPGSPEVRL